MAGCRCDACRGANAAYERARIAARAAGEWNGLVNAERTRKHVAELSARGVGRNVVADVSGVARSVIAAIASGEKQSIRARTERAVLAVTEQAAADGAYIDARETWKLVDELIADGWSKAEIARRLGYARPALQFSRRGVTVRNAFEVKRLYERLRVLPIKESRRVLELLDELSEEGFRRERVREKLEAMARAAGVELELLEPRKGRVHAAAAPLVQALHESLTT